MKYIGSMKLHPDLIERIKKRYGENSSTYKMVLEQQKNQTDEQLIVTGSIDFNPKKRND